MPQAVVALDPKSLPQFSLWRKLPATHLVENDDRRANSPARQKSPVRSFLGAGPGVAFPVRKHLPLPAAIRRGPLPQSPHPPIGPYRERPVRKSFVKMEGQGKANQQRPGIAGQGSGITGGTMNVCWIVSCWKPITSGKRSPGNSCTSKISSTAVWNSRKAMTWPLRTSTAATPHFNCSLRASPAAWRRQRT